MGAIHAPFGSSGGGGIPSSALLAKGTGLTDTLNPSARTLQGLSYLNSAGSLDLTHASLVGTETVTSKEGTATVTPAAGKLTIGAGTLFDLTLSNGSYYPGVCGILSATQGDVRFISSDDFRLQPTSPRIGAGTAISGITTDIEGNQLYPPYNIGPYGAASGALDTGASDYTGKAKLNITPVSNPTDTTLVSGHTYSLADSAAVRTALKQTDPASGETYDVKLTANHNADRIPGTMYIRVVKPAGVDGNAYSVAHT